MARAMTQTESMQVEAEPFWARVRQSLGTLRTSRERQPAYGTAAIARSLGMKPQLGSELEDVLSEAWDVSAAMQVSLSLLVVEIDRYKDYFNAYGRAEAERCMTEVMEALCSTLPRPQDQCLRLGRNQFVVVLPDYPLLMARVAGQKLAAAVHDAGMPHKESHAGIVTVGIGIAVCNPAGALQKSFIETAMAALSKAQRRGLNRIEAIDLRKAKARQAA